MMTVREAGVINFIPGIPSITFETDRGALCKTYMPTHCILDHNSISLFCHEHPEFLPGGHPSSVHILPATQFYELLKPHVHEMACVRTLKLVGDWRLLVERYPYLFTLLPNVTRITVGRDINATDGMPRAWDTQRRTSIECFLNHMITIYADKDHAPRIFEQCASLALEGVPVNPRTFWRIARVLLRVLSECTTLSIDCIGFGCDMGGSTRDLPLLYLSYLCMKILKTAIAKKLNDGIEGLGLDGDHVGKGIRSLYLHDMPINSHTFCLLKSNTMCSVSASFRYGSWHWWTRGVRTWFDVEYLLTERNEAQLLIGCAMSTRLALARFQCIEVLTFPHAPFEAEQMIQGYITAMELLSPDEEYRTANGTNFAARVVHNQVNTKLIEVWPEMKEKLEKAGQQDKVIDTDFDCVLVGERIDFIDSEDKHIDSGVHALPRIRVVEEAPIPPTQPADDQAAVRNLVPTFNLDEVLAREDLPEIPLDVDMLF